MALPGVHTLTQEAVKAFASPLPGLLTEWDSRERQGPWDEWGKGDLAPAVSKAFAVFQAAYKHTHTLVLLDNKVDHARLIAKDTVFHNMVLSTQRRSRAQQKVALALLEKYCDTMAPGKTFTSPLEMKAFLQGDLKKIEASEFDMALAISLAADKEKEAYEALRRVLPATGPDLPPFISVLDFAQKKRASVTESPGLTQL